MSSTPRLAIPSVDDGVNCIVIHERAQTELGRLLCGVASVPQVMYGFNNPKTDSGTWDTFYQAVRDCGTAAQQQWALDYFSDESTVLDSQDKSSIAKWFMAKIEQNWYLLDLLLTSRLPVVFTYQSIEILGSQEKVYYPIQSHQFLVETIHSLRLKRLQVVTAQQVKDEKRQRKRDLKAGVYHAASHKPKR